MGIFTCLSLEKASSIFLETPTFLMAAGTKTSTLSQMLGCSHVVSWDGRVLKSRFYGQMSPVCRMQDTDSLSFLGILKDFTNYFWKPSSWCRTVGSLGHYEFHSAPVSCVCIHAHVCRCVHACVYMLICVQVHVCICMHTPICL